MQTTDKWNRLYESATEPNSPCKAVIDNTYLLKPPGAALELACGLGGNAIYLAELGFRVSAWDISDVAIQHLQRFAAQKQLHIDAQVQDLSRTTLAVAAFDLIIVSAFLDRRLCPAISAALKPGGLLIYQTYTQLKLTPGGPSNPDYLLAEGELLQLFSDLKPRVYHEDHNCGDLEKGLRSQAYLIAQKPR